MNEPEHVKNIMDAGALGTMIATFAGWLPNVAASLTVIWTAIRIWESRTVQRLLGRKDNEAQ